MSEAKISSKEVARIIEYLKGLGDRKDAEMVRVIYSELNRLGHECNNYAVEVHRLESKVKELQDLLQKESNLVGEHMAAHYMATKELEALNESLQGMPELTNELAQVGEIARQEADTYNMIEAFKVGYEAIRKAVEGNKE